jgi:hypothetical protein
MGQKKSRASPALSISILLELVNSQFAAHATQVALNGNHIDTFRQTLSAYSQSVLTSDAIYRCRSANNTTIQISNNRFNR